MTIDDLGRAAGTAARRKASQEVEPAMMLQQLRRTHRTRNILAAAASVVVVALAALVLVRLVAPDTRSQPPGTHSPTPSATCPEGVTCLGGGLYRLKLPVPVTLTVPSNYNGDLTQLSPDAFEDYRNDTSDAGGITIMENATAASNDVSYSQDTSGGSTADSMATWFTHRPFLANATKTPIVVDGKHGWLLTGAVRAGAALGAEKNHEPAAPTFRTSVATSAVTERLHGQYVLLDTPGAGVTVIWIWTYDPSGSALENGKSYLDRLTFG
jgi:hypothetical protein